MSTFFLRLNSVGRPKSGFFRYVARPCVLFTDGCILSCQYPDSCSCLAGLTTIPRDLIFTTRANIHLYNRSSRQRTSTVIPTYWSQCASAARLRCVDRLSLEWFRQSCLFGYQGQYSVPTSFSVSPSQSISPPYPWATGRGQLGNVLHIACIEQKFGCFRSIVLTWGPAFGMRTITFSAR